MLALVVDLPEPLAYGLAVTGILALQRDRRTLGGLLLGMALFAKEVTLLFVAAVLVDDLLNRRWRLAINFGVLSVFPFLIFQGWLWLVFGSPGIGSGGALATPFELIPFMGLLRIAQVSFVYFLAMLVVFGPTIVWPSMWGLWKSSKFFLAGDRNMLVLALFLNSLMIVTMPFSTFRETGGVLRIACGLATAVLLFASRYRQRHVLNLTIFWLVLNVFLLKS
jgi:hypothetical protein